MERMSHPITGISMSVPCSRYQYGRIWPNGFKINSAVEKEMGLLVEHVVLKGCSLLVVCMFFNKSPGWNACTSRANPADQIRKGLAQVQLAWRPG